MRKTLITILSCNRIGEVKKYIWGYIDFCNKNESFDFLLSLDGTEKDYASFCTAYKIPLLYSEKREGVGLSKNRVLEKFPNYDSYFFIEDDVELINDAIFQETILIAQELNYAHLCGYDNRFKTKSYSYKNHIISETMKGGGYLNFFTKKGLEKVGGWNTVFAKYKRYGHTEHSYRFFHSNLQPAPFIFSDKLLSMVILHDPLSVSPKQKLATMNQMELIDDEWNLIQQKTTYFPLKTISTYYFNGFNMSFNKTVEDFLKSNKKKYPLTSKKERKDALSNHYFLKIFKTNCFVYKVVYFFKSMLYNPINNSFKYYIKKKLYLT